MHAGVCEFQYIHLSDEIYKILSTVKLKLQTMLMRGYPKNALATHKVGAFSPTE